MRAVLLAALVLAGCGAPDRQLPVLGQVPAFTLTSHHGGEFRSAVALEGRIWVADFIFTSCMGPCPRMTSQMHSVEQRTRDLRDLRFVSFTVDPETDIPPVLEAYAKKFHADTARWAFLTGPQKLLHSLGRDAFKLHNVDGSFAHSTRFVLVDGRGNIRGYYDTSEAGSLDELVADIRTLAKERS